MSRYRDWTNGWSGAATYLMNIDKKLNADNIIKQYSKENNIAGSFSQKCLHIGKNWNHFKKYIDGKFNRNS